MLEKYQKNQSNLTKINEFSQYYLKKEYLQFIFCNYLKKTLTTLYFSYPFFLFFEFRIQKSQKKYTKKNLIYF